MGLRAVIVIDDVRLGPAAGGIRTRAYSSSEEAVEDCARLARAMTIKCALAGLDAGGGKGVVFLHDGLRRAEAFEALGRRIEQLGGIFRTSGDYGTTEADLLAMARHTQYVHTDVSSLSKSAARGVVACIEAAAKARGLAASVRGLRVLVQGAGSMGGAVARTLKNRGAELLISDLDPTKARELAEVLDAEPIAPKDALFQQVDVVSPCAVGGVIDEAVAERMRCQVVCGAANNTLGSESAGAVLMARGITFVPDQISSAGAVVDGIGASVMGLPDRSALIDALGQTAHAVLVESAQSGRTPTQVALSRARARLEAAGPEQSSD